MGDGVQKGLTIWTTENDLAAIGIITAVAESGLIRQGKARHVPFHICNDLGPWCRNREFLSILSDCPHSQVKCCPRFSFLTSKQSKMLNCIPEILFFPSSTSYSQE